PAAVRSPVSDGAEAVAAPGEEVAPQNPAAVEKPKPDIETPARAVARPLPPIRAEGERPLAAPSVRLRARDAGIDLRQVRGSGPAGRISHEDLEAFLSSGGLPPPSGPRPD